MESAHKRYWRQIMLLLRDAKQALPNSDVDYGQLLQIAKDFRGISRIRGICQRYMQELNRQIFRGFEYGRH